MLIREIVYAAVLWLKRFPVTYGIYDNISHWAILKGTKIQLFFHFLLEFGDYVHTNEDGDNSMEVRTIEALDLQHTGNSQDGHFFLNLQTGYLFTHYK